MRGCSKRHYRAVGCFSQTTTRWYLSHARCSAGFAQCKSYGNAGLQTLRQHAAVLKLLKIEVVREVEL